MDYGECVLEQESLGHSREDATEICDGIRERFVRGMLYKAVARMDVFKRGNDIILYGPASWELLDKEGDFITTEAQHNFLRKLFTQAHFKAVMDEHKNFIAGEPLLKFVGKDGREWFSHVHEKGMMLLCKVRPDDGLEKTRELRDKVLRGEYRSYSIAGRPVRFEKKKVKNQLVTYHFDIDPDEISLCREGVNPKATFRVIQKSTPEKPKDTVASEVEQLKQDVARIRQDIYRNLPEPLRKFKEEQDRQAEELRKAFEQILARREDLQKYQCVTKERQKKDEDKRRTGQRLR